MKIIKSLGALLAGMIVGIVLSLGTDKVLVNMGVIPSDNLWVPATTIWFVLAYRTLYNMLSCYIIARLAPSSPMRLALIAGVIGTLASVAGAIVTKDMNVGPAWYAWTLALLTLPSAWLGGWLYTKK
jgi:hypothetical protein